MYRSGRYQRSLIGKRESSIRSLPVLDGNGFKLRLISVFEVIRMAANHSDHHNTRFLL
jgi:hypothetical protein